MRKIGFALVLVLVLAGAAVADTYVLNASESWGQGPFGTVTLTQSATNVVTITVNVTPNKVLYGTGGHYTFAFNGTSGLSYLTLPTGFTGNPYHSDYYMESPFGKFDYTVDCARATCNNTNHASGAPFSFTFKVTRAGLTPADFALLSKGSTPAFFAVDIFDAANGKTGAVGARCPQPPPPPVVPEPGSLALLGSGLLGAGGFLRRRILG